MISSWNDNHGIFYISGKAEGTYSPQAQEKDLEMSGKIDEGTEDPKNLYDDIDVIKNPNAERLIWHECCYGNIRMLRCANRYEVAFWRCFFFLFADVCANEISDKLHADIYNL